MAELRDQLQATLGDGYTLEQELGGGGMSRVFVAQESALGRKVVVKVLPPEMAAAVSLDRFRREIQLAAQLQHPHIVPLLTAGDTNGLPYFTMPFVRGESLRSRLLKGGELPVSETVRILREVASAIAYAHENNIVHRDIKPENVLISGGSAVVTDFGVAKALSASSEAAPDTLTSMGVALGTPAYMSPEQATADPNTDHRADIYALGVMAYEMLTGSTPFTGRSPQATLAAHVTEVPDAITRRRSTIPPVLASLVMSCLEKRPADRPQTAHEVMHRLDALSTPSGGLARTVQATAVKPAKEGKRTRRIAVFTAVAVAAAIAAFGLTEYRKRDSVSTAKAETPVIAVLPFENLGRPEGREFTDGMTEEITSRLSSLRGLKVIGRQTSKSYAGTTKTPQQIASELGVNYVLTGTVRWDRTGDGKDIVRVSPALVRTADATQVWAKPFETILSGIFEVQSKVATEVANALDVALLQPEKDALAARPTESVEAYSHYLRGTELLRTSLQVPDIRTAIAALEKAVALDPQFALAHSQLSIGHTGLFWFESDRTAERLRKARASADRALSLQPSLATAHLALAIYYYQGLLDFESALKELSIAQQARPNDFEILFYKAAIERRQGKWRESIANMNRAIEIEPRIGSYISDFADTHYTLREYDQAERLADRALIVTPREPDALGLKSEIAIARDGDVPRALQFVRQRFAAEAGARGGLGSAAADPFNAGWPALADQKIRDALLSAQWRPELDERSSFLVNRMMLFYVIQDMPRARAYADSALGPLASKVRERSDDARYYSRLGRVQAILGRRQEALAAADKAISLRPVSKDAYGGPDFVANRAVILMMLGDTDRAISEMQSLLEIPSPVSRNAIRLNPLFAALRSHPRFNDLVRGP
ncbi:MAG: protein kinase [Gemmatimonadaceae bacterium]